MTKKDYVAIGNALRRRYGLDTQDKHLPTRMENAIPTAQAIADVFATDNPSFDRERFLRFVETGKDTRSWGDN